MPSYLKVKQGMFQMESDPSQKGSQVGSMTSPAPCDDWLSKNQTRHHTTDLKTPQQPATCHELYFYYTHNDHEHINLALHSNSDCLQFLPSNYQTVQNQIKCHQEKWIRQMNKLLPTAAYNKGSLSFCQQQYLACMPTIPHGAMVRTGWLASDII